ncbi:DUF6153 family protein [Curtobacterium sp. KT1]|uniref:DUF6153 family protein n=1 Tax=Curtobacterium sp. KT1 TaxID=3372858 RepID=UPI0037C12BA9
MGSAREHRVAARTLHGLLLSVGIALLVIAGLLGMHALSVGHATPGVGHNQTAAHATHSASAHHNAVAESASHHDASTPVVLARTGICSGDGCGGAAHDHAMQLMMCVLALLSVALVLLVPRLLGPWFLPLPSISTQLGVLLRSLPQPRPPSLHVLSISRT